MVQQHPHRKVDEQPDDVIQSGNKRTCCERRIDVITIEHQRNECSESRGKDDYRKE
jgi:hypothetical protein